MARSNPYTQSELATILRMHKEGYPAKVIAEKVGRTPYAIHQVVHRQGKGWSCVEGDKVVPKEERPVLQQNELTPREMIKKLYDMGYRIENNKLVCYVKQVVNIQDVIGK